MTIEDLSQVETANDYGVGTDATGRVVIVSPPSRALESDEALRLAAWLVVLSDLDGHRFWQVHDAVVRHCNEADAAELNRRLRASQAADREVTQ